MCLFLLTLEPILSLSLSLSITLFRDHKQNRTHKTCASVYTQTHTPEQNRPKDFAFKAVFLSCGKYLERKPFFLQTFLGNTQQHNPNICLRESRQIRYRKQKSGFLKRRLIQREHVKSCDELGRLETFLVDRYSQREIKKEREEIKLGRKHEIQK